jgi:NADH:ubiquinone oxidoreductase subunit 5 (subunit L)/multisubunit Na+/H+ antiporter MnhA subunit
MEVGVVAVTEQLLTVAMLVVPAAGGIVALIVPDRRNSVVGVAGSLSCIAAALWLTCVLAGVVESPVSLSAGRWLTIPAIDGLALQLSFQADRPRVLLVLAASLAVLLESIGSAAAVNNAETGNAAESQPAGLAILYPAGVAAILASDLVILLGIWIMLDCCVGGLQRRVNGSRQSGRQRLETATVLSGSSVLLLIATLMASARFGTTNLPEMIERCSLDDRVDAVAVASGLSVLFALAVAIRCALFPAMIWPRTCLESRPRDAGFIVILAGVLPGISLAIGTQPLSAISADGSLLLGMLGVLTCLTATGVALVQNDSDGVSTLLIVSAAGLAASALASGHPSAGVVAGCTLFAQVVAIQALKHSGEKLHRGFPFGCAMVATVSGICGGNAILSLVESALRRVVGSEHVAALPPDRFLSMIWWGIVASQILWGFAIVRLISSRGSAVDSRRSKSLKLTEPVRGRRESALLTIAAILALGACVFPLSDATGPDQPSSTRLLSFGAVTPACLLGVVVAWLLAQASENVRSRVAGSFDSLARLSREWFYLEDAIRYAVVLPVRGLVLVVEICDRRIFGGTSEDGWQQTPARLADSMEHLRLQPSIYYGLTGVLLVVGLLWSLS